MHYKIDIQYFIIKTKTTKKKENFFFSKGKSCLQRDLRNQRFNK